MPGAAATAAGSSGSTTTQLRNNYDKGTSGVFNGTGVVTAMSLPRLGVAPQSSSSPQPAPG
jgi:hypothetical protein